MIKEFYRNKFRKKFKTEKQSLLYIYVSYEYNPTDVFAIPFNTRKKVTIKVNRLTGGISGVYEQNYTTNNPDNLMKEAFIDKFNKFMNKPVVEVYYDLKHYLRNKIK